MIPTIGSGWRQIQLWRNWRHRELFTMSNTTTNIRRVLFVDDEAPFLEILKVLMEALSAGTWEVSTADTPSKAFGILQNHGMDVVVLDLQMGEMDGMQMLSLLNRSYPN